MILNLTRYGVVCKPVIDPNPEPVIKQYILSGQINIIGNDGTVGTLNLDGVSISLTKGISLNEGTS